MYYPHLRNALDQYCQYISNAFKQGVQVKSGALRDSLRISCTVNDTSYSISVSLNDYWKYLPQPFPWDDAFRAAGMQPPLTPTRFSSSEGYQRYAFNPHQWESILSEALATDIRYYLNSLS